MPNDESTELDPRFVRLRQIFNFRDLGGVHTGNGQTVRTGLVYRSDQFAMATDDDIEILTDKLGLKTVVDLRRPAEIADTGSFPDGLGVNVINLELKHLAWESIGRNVSAEASPVPFLTERYTAMIETGADAIKDTLDLMCEATPLVFHCMAGKDRTGIIAAVALALLGVPAHTIAADYALTHHGRTRYQAWRTKQGLPHIDLGLAAEPAAMTGLLTAIDQAFGSIEGYARAIGFQHTETLKERLLDS